ncbi:MAG: enoyl-CoA hydratase/isomerase family protein [Burkholderiales bacterium]
MRSYPALASLKIDQRARVVVVTIDHPPINLMDRTMIRDLRTLLGELRSDADARCIVFRSANPEFFISHLDLNLAAKGLDAPPTKPTKLSNLQALFEDYRRLDQATIAIVEGAMNGGGTEFCMSLDMRFAAIGRARIGQFEVALGCLPGATGTQRLANIAGRARALELILGCDDIDAETAERYGLVNRALDPDILQAFVENLARRIASFPAAAIASAKQAVDAANPHPQDGLLEEAHLAAQLMSRDETKRRFSRILAMGAQTIDFERELARRLLDLDEASES